MATVKVASELSCAWYGPSLVITNTRGECGPDQPLSGYYLREPRFLGEVRLELNGDRPWPCAAGGGEQQTLAFNFRHPEELGDRPRRDGGRRDIGRPGHPVSGAPVAALRAIEAFLAETSASDLHRDFKYSTRSAFCSAVKPSALATS